MERQLSNTSDMQATAAQRQKEKKKITAKSKLLTFNRHNHQLSVSDITKHQATKMGLSKSKIKID